MSFIRYLALVSTLTLACAGSAQPQPPDVTFTVAASWDPLTPFRNALRIEHHYRNESGERSSFGAAGTWERLPLQGAPLFRDTTTGWTVFRPAACWCDQQYLLFIAGTDTLRLELPDDHDGKQALIDRARSRWDRSTPEVIHFIPGRSVFAAVISQPPAEAVAAAFAERLRREAEEDYQRDVNALAEHYRTHPAVPPPAEQEPHAPLTPEAIAAERASQPGLHEVAIDRLNADTVWVRITGRVLLNGGCASGMPLFGIEFLTDTGWVERLPLELTQMDCGMPWADWDQHVVMIPPLRWWVGANQPAGKKELLPGTYRLVFAGSNGERMRSDRFILHG